MEAELEEATIAELQARMTSGEVSAAALTQAYLDRITTLDQAGPRLGAERHSRNTDPHQRQHRYGRPDDDNRRLTGAPGPSRQA
jgi:Asp-tRNA(Asn)/Glu-tRNA(Gln) amidotransferase A subunit family amidase